MYCIYLQHDLPRLAHLPQQPLPPARTLGIQIRLLAQTNGPLPQPLAKPLIIIRRRMIDAAIIPDRQIILILPAQAHLQIVILHDQLHEPLEEVLALRLAHLIDALGVVADGEDALPARDGIGANDRVHGFEVGADVERVAALGGVELEVVLGGGFVEEGLCVGGGEGFEEFLVGWGDAVVDFVAGGPERVAARLGQLGQAQDGVVRGDGLEGDV